MPLPGLAGALLSLVVAGAGVVSVVVVVVVSVVAPGVVVVVVPDVVPSGVAGVTVLVVVVLVDDVEVAGVSLETQAARDKASVTPAEITAKSFNFIAFNISFKLW